VVITSGTAQNVALTSGNNQTGNAGQLLQSPLVATVTDGCGIPVTGAHVTWTVTGGSATLSKTVSTSGSSGQVSTFVNFGSTPGPVTVTASFATSSTVTFTVTSQAVVSSMTILNGNNQTVTVGNAFPQSLTVQIKDASGNPIPGATVNFAVSAGNASVSPTSAQTDSQGRAATIASAAQNPGNITVTASYLSVSATFSLTAVPQGPVVNAANFQNAASFQAGLVPCGLATATGSGLAPGITGTVSGASFLGALPYTLNGLSLSVNGTPAPIYTLTNANGKQQVTFQTPCEAAPGSGTVVIQLNGATTTVQNVTILQIQPGIFFSTGTNGTAYGEVIDSNGNYLTAQNPAKRGQNYYLIATGLGQLTPATSTDAAGVNGQNVALPVIVGVSGAGVPVFEQIYAPGYVGLYVIGFTIPTTNPAGTDQPLVVGVTVNGQVVFSNQVYINSVQ
jgi:adhesin/invasin